MRNENTILDIEKTKINNNDSSTVIDNNSKETPREEVKENKSVAATASASGGKIIATGVGGVLLGTAISHASDYFASDSEEVVEEVTDQATPEEGTAPEATAAPEWSNGQVNIATGVTDSMSFNEAFATARAEVGPGGAFEWNGNVYGTYYADEWNNMTAEEKADYNNQFNWGSIDTSNNEQIAQEVTETAEVYEPEADLIDEYVAEETIEEEVIIEAEETTETDEVAMEGESEIEVLGIVSDPETGVTAVPIMVDDVPAALIDIDNDEVIDLIVANIDENEEITEDEIADISEYGITIDDVESCMNDDYSVSSFDDGSSSIDYDESFDI